MRIADSHDNVTILFADIAGFTKISDSLPPAELVDLLSQLFSRFDQLAAKHGLEKIKTIGDGYMVVGGAPEARPDHAIVIAKLALEMLQALTEFNGQAGRDLEMRIGISTGSVVAGVIGTSKFAYDLWGDSVNVAARMEQAAPRGGIQVSEATYQLLKGHFKLQARGHIDIKGKGEMPAYLLKAEL
jgi:guanylate cyclase